MQKQVPVRRILIGFLILLVSVGTVFGFRYAKQAQKAKGALQTVTAGKTLGPDSAPVRILDFSDFQCPACAVSVSILERFMEKYPGKIQIVFKHFPLRMHVWSAVAHQSAECAAEQNKFWDFYHKLYKNQSAWAALPDPMVTFVTYAAEVGLNRDNFTKCMVDPVAAERIAGEKKEGEVLEVKSTPTFFINGKMFAGPMELQIGGEALIRKTLGLPPQPSLASGTSSQPAGSASLPQAQPASETKLA